LTFSVTGSRETLMATSAGIVQASRQRRCARRLADGAAFVTGVVLLTPVLERSRASAGAAGTTAAGRRRGFTGALAEHERDQGGDLLVAPDRMTERQVVVDLVAVPPALPEPLDVARLFEIGHDPLHRTLGDADEIGDVAHAHLRLPGDAEEHVGVVGEERPGRLRRRRRPGRGAAPS
jgi:hypothetical protein